LPPPALPRDGGANHDDLSVPQPRHGEKLGGVGFVQAADNEGLAANKRKIKIMTTKIFFILYFKRFFLT